MQKLLSLGLDFLCLDGFDFEEIKELILVLIALDLSFGHVLGLHFPNFSTEGWFKLFVHSFHVVLSFGFKLLVVLLLQIGV